MPICLHMSVESPQGLFASSMSIVSLFWLKNSTSSEAYRTQLRLPAVDAQRVVALNSIASLEACPKSGRDAKRVKNRASLSWIKL